MNQTERLDKAKCFSVICAFLAVVASFLSLMILFIYLSAWPPWWLYIITVASGVYGFVVGYKARSDLIDLGVYKHSNVYQGTAVISLGCSSIALLILALGLFMAFM
jgi:hypothetical protein